MVMKLNALRLLLVLSLLITGLYLYLKLQIKIQSMQGSIQSNNGLPGSSVAVLGNDLQRATYLNYLNKYCHRSLLDLATSLGASTEGQLSTEDTHSKHYELLHVHVVARHGDRSPVSMHHIGAPLHYQCGLVDGKINWSGLKDFPQQLPLPHNAVMNHAEVKLHPGPPHLCGIGKLTSDGFLQHYSLGLLIRTIYKDFVDELFIAEDIAKNIFVQSTDFSRTIHSAGAFLLGFLPDDPNVRRATSIHVSADQGTLFLESPPPGIRTSYMHCKHLWRIISRSLEKISYFSARENLFNDTFHRFCEMFDFKCQRESFVTEYFDHVLSRGCHNQKSPLPCNHKGDCIDYKFASELAHFSDWTWNHRHSVNSSIVAVMPFLKHSVIGVMKKVVQTNSGSTAPKVMLSFAHDYTLMMLLKALTVSTEVGWMPYASRLVFEVWRRKEPSTLYVRILFNGVPITHAMDLPVTRTKYGDLVEFSSWRDSLVTGNYRSLESYNSVCGIHSTSHDL